MLSLVAVTGCATSSTARSSDEVRREAEDFMATYAVDLEKADRAALAARYDPRGNFMIFEGRKYQVTHEQTTKQYMKTWQPPVRFAWQDLSYDVLNPDVVAVLGHFLWTKPGEEKPERYSYTGVLVRDPASGRLKIRLENEFVMRNEKQTQ